MKKSIVFIFMLAGVFALQSCSEDFDVAAPYKNITVIYSALNMKDTAHYVRIQKAFLDQSKNAIDMAKVADSSFYPEDVLSVLVRTIDNGTIVGNSIPLKRVDMNQEGYAKDSGIFFQSPNYAYKFKQALNPAYRYRLVVENVKTGDKDSSEINIIDSSFLTIRGDLHPTNPNAVWPLSFANATSPNKEYQLYVDAGPTGIPGRASFLEGVIRFNWVDVQLSSGLQTPRSADFRFSTAEVASGQALKAANIAFYNFLIAAMQPAPAGIARMIDTADLFIYGAGKDYLSYINTLQIQSSGLSANQMKPAYTNIKGNDVFGLFSSRTSRFKKLRIDDVTMDSLKTSSRVSALNIQGRLTP